MGSPGPLHTPSSHYLYKLTIGKWRCVGPVDRLALKVIAQQGLRHTIPALSLKLSNHVSEYPSTGEEGT